MASSALKYQLLKKKSPGNSEQILFLSKKRKHLFPFYSELSTTRSSKGRIGNGKEEEGEREVKKEEKEKKKKK